MSLFWLLELDEDLHGARRGKVWREVRKVESVRGLTDLRAITLETLATILMSDAEFAAGLELVNVRRRTSSPDHLIRAYWKRVRQPKLPGVN